MIHEFHDIVDDKNLCDKAIDFFVNCNREQFFERTSKFKGKTVPTLRIGDSRLRTELKVISYKISQKLHCIDGEFIFPEYSNIVIWSPGQDMSVHTDNKLDIIKQRHYTAVCYLNDDYSGGETFLPDHDYVCKPEKGKVIVFPSDYPHGVKTIERGMRYTLAMWFTRDKNFVMW